MGSERRLAIKGIYCKQSIIKILSKSPRTESWMPILSSPYPSHKLYTKFTTNKFRTAITTKLLKITNTSSEQLTKSSEHLINLAAQNIKYKINQIVQVSTKLLREVGGFLIYISIRGALLPSWAERWQQLTFKGTVDRLR